MKLSAVVITLNEESNLPRCLKSLEGIADEVVVVDSLSTDRTCEIARERGAKVFSRAWEGYSSAKNFGGEKATHDLILSIDADEEVSPELRASLLSVKESGGFDAWNMTLVTWYCGRFIRHCGWYPDVKIRLFDRRKGRWGGSIHEKVRMDPGSRVGRLAGDCRNYGYFSAHEHLAQINLFTTLMAKRAFEAGERSGLVRAAWRGVDIFFTMYVLRRGFLDGALGFQVCVISAFGETLKHLKIRELARPAPKPESP